MTLRDLSKRQLYNLRRRSQKELKLWMARPTTREPAPVDLWNAAYNFGLKAGLSLQPILEAQK